MAKIGPKQHLTNRERRERWRLEAKAKSAVNITPEPPDVQTDGKKVRHKKRSKLASPTRRTQHLHGISRKKKLDDDIVLATSLKNLDSLFEEMKSLFGVSASAEETPDLKDSYKSLEARFPAMLMTPPSSHPDIYTLVAKKKDAAAAPSRPANISFLNECSTEESATEPKPWTTSGPSNLAPVTPPQTPKFKPQPCTVSRSYKHTSIPVALTPPIVKSGPTSHSVELDAASTPDQELESQRKRSRNLSDTLPDNTTKLSPTHFYTPESLAREGTFILEMITRRNSEKAPSPSIEPPEDILSEPHKLTPCSSKTQRASAPQLDPRSEPIQLISRPLSSAFSMKPRLARARSSADKHPKVNSSTRTSMDITPKTRRSLGTSPSQAIATDTVVEELGSTASTITNTKASSSRKSIDVEELREVLQNTSNPHIPPRSIQFAAIDQNTSKTAVLSLPSSTAQKLTSSSAKTAASVSKELVYSHSTISYNPANPVERASSIKRPENRDISTAYPKGFSATAGTQKKRSTSEQSHPVSALEESTLEEGMAKTALPVDKDSRSIIPPHPRRAVSTITPSPPLRDKTSEPGPSRCTRLQQDGILEFTPVPSKNQPAFIFGDSSQGPTTPIWLATSNVPTNEATNAPADEKSQSPELVNVFDYFRKRWTAGDDHIPYTPPAKEKRDKVEMPSEGNGESVVKKEAKKLKKRRGLSSFVS